MGRNGTSDRAGNVAIAESQPAVHYRSQVVFDWARLDRHKSLPQPLLVMSCTVSRVHGYCRTAASEMDASRSRRNQLVGKAEARLLRAAYRVRISAKFVVAAEINSEQ